MRFPDVRCVWWLLFQVTGVRWGFDQTCWRVFVRVSGRTWVWGSRPLNTHPWECGESSNPLLPPQVVRLSAWHRGPSEPIFTWSERVKCQNLIVDPPSPLSSVSHGPLSLC